MERLFTDLPHAIASTADLSQRLGFTLEDLGYEFPRYPLPPGETAASYLRAMTLRGAAGRYRGSPHRDRAFRQIDRELSVIGRLRLEGYFLIVWDMVEFARRNGILCQGRGSAANSAVCYSLGITAVDPVGMDLLFERFLSEERGEWPDIDVDLPSGDQRERVIQHVYERYGQRGAGMTANVITYRGKSAVREMGKVLGFPEEMIGGLSKRIHGFEYVDSRDDLLNQAADAGLDRSDPRVAHWLRLCLDIQGLPRHLGQHSGGMVICQGDLDSVVPLENARMPGRVVVQWDKEDCADLGIIKVDLLGLGMMAVLEESTEIIRSARRLVRPRQDPFGRPEDIQDDPAGRHGRGLPDREPGPDGDSAAGSVRPASTTWSSRSRSSAPVRSRATWCIPTSTAGSAASRCGTRTRRSSRFSSAPWGCRFSRSSSCAWAMTAAGFTGGQAEQLRRAMGFKRSVERMGEIEGRLRRGLSENGIEADAADEIVRSITSFALYGFPESHSASFALLAYASSYLKAHYPAEFLAALLNCQPMGFYSPAVLVKDAQRHGVRVLPIDVNESGVRCSVADMPAGTLDVAPRVASCVRIGLMYVSAMRAGAAAGIAEERVRGGRFRSIGEFVRRVRLQKSELDVLAEIGALNSLGEGIHRREALWQMESVWRPKGPLFAGQDDELPEPGPLAAMSPLERLEADYRGAGLTVGKHPMHYLRGRVAGMGVLSSREMEAAPDGQRVRVAGAVITRQRPGYGQGLLFRHP